MDLEDRFQHSGRGRNGNLNIVAADTGTKTLISAYDANHTLFIQRIVVYITTDAAQNIQFQDSAATPIKVAKIPTSPGVDTRWEFSFTPKGIPLTKGKDFTAVLSAAGLACTIEWEAYQRPIMTTEVTNP